MQADAERTRRLLRLSYPPGLDDHANTNGAKPGSASSERKKETPPATGKAGGKADLPELAGEPNLVCAVQRDIEAVGVAGEEKTALTLYVIGTSRLLANPLSGLVQGDSSTGKSHLITKIAELMPPQQVLWATRLTPQALYHLTEPIAHKFVVGGERSRVQDNANADQTAALRQLRSEKRITKQISVRNGASFVTQEVTVQGPIAFVESTTLAESLIFPEDLNRGLIVKTDESEEQNRQVMLEMAKPYSTKAEPVDADAILRRHHEFQLSLRPLDVRIPFVERLAEKLPAAKPQSRRVFGQVTATIEAIAFLHQHLRRRDNDGRVLATRDDYLLARRLLLEPLRETVGLSEGVWKAYLQLRERFRGEFSSTDALPLNLFKTKPTRDKHLNELADLGVIACVRKAAGPNPSRWRLTGKTLDELVLPRVEDLCVNA
jgi:hypothetical protein